MEIGSGRKQNERKVYKNIYVNEVMQYWINWKETAQGCGMITEGKCKLKILWRSAPTSMVPKNYYEIVWFSNESKKLWKDDELRPTDQLIANRGWKSLSTKAGKGYICNFEKITNGDWR